MISGLADHVENEIALNQVTSPESIVQVDACPWPVIAHVINHLGAVNNYEFLPYSGANGRSSTLLFAAIDCT